MAKKKLPPAQVPCSACLKKAKQTAKFVVVECLHNQAVAILPIKDSEIEGVWRIYSPASLADVVEISKKVRKE